MLNYVDMAKYTQELIDKARSIVHVSGCTMDQAFAILRFQRESKRRDEKRNHLRTTKHGHLFGENRCCTRCGLLEATYRMEHEHLELDKVITCQDRIDCFRYNAYLGIGVYMPKHNISAVSF